MTKALIVVDVQKDFCEGGSLAVNGGLRVSHEIHDLIEQHGKIYYKRIFATKDWHNPQTDNGGHFHDSPDFLNTWPGHCVASSDGAEFANGLNALQFDDTFHKGWDEPAYSGFQGNSARHPAQSLEYVLRCYGIEELDICGIASTHCVLATVLDALRLGFKVRVLERLTVGVNVDGTGQAHKDAIEQMEKAGAEIVYGNA